MKKLMLALLCTLPLSAMQNTKEELLKDVKAEQCNGYATSAAQGAFAGYAFSNAVIMSIVGGGLGGVISVPVIAAGAGIGVGTRYLYNKYTDQKGK